ncbi:Uncharacterised protein [Neisseria canis]|uniref:Uncharacterized protein n=1 Tax=Neisseria canis TaxID=493 RepID=A0A3S4NPN1_9NEIS|nr:Uncharacterised protein [Neisseria canis]
MYKTMPSETFFSDGIGTEAQTTRARVPHTLYAWDLAFMQATAYYIYLRNIVTISSYIYKVN